MTPTASGKLELKLWLPCPKKGQKLANFKRFMDPTSMKHGEKTAKSSVQKTTDIHHHSSGRGLAGVQGAMFTSSLSRETVPPDAAPQHGGAAGEAVSLEKNRVHKHRTPVPSQTPARAVVEYSCCFPNLHGA